VAAEKRVAKRRNCLSLRISLGRSGLIPRVNRCERKAARRRPLRFAISTRQAKRTRIPAVLQRQFQRRGILRARHRPTPRKRCYSVRPTLPFWGHFPFALSPRVSSVERMQSPRAAGCFVRVGVRSKISVKSVDGAPRQQDGYDQPHRSPHHDLSPVGSIHQRLPATDSQPRRPYRH
jgi:hypothetical protein